MPGLGFQQYADAIANAVRGGEPPQFTIGLYGAWGSGKSSLLNAVKNALSAGGSNVIPVYFDAWRYEKAEHIIVPMLHSMHKAVQDTGDGQVADYLKRAIGSVIYSLNFSIRYFGGVELKPQDVKTNWQNRGLPALDEAFSKPFNELRKIPQALDGRRIVVLIDDLDRCSPEKVVSVLESINLVMDVPGLIFVLALDYDVLIKAINIKYPHVSGDEFIRKMVQIPFRVPPLDLEGTDFLPALIPDWSLESYDLPVNFPSHVRDIAVLGLDANPRQIKRLINSFLLLHRVVMSRSLSIDLNFLAALIGVQLGWPDHYRRFQEAVMAGDEKPFSVFTDADEQDKQPPPALVRYTKDVFDEEVSNDKIKQVMHLTRAVAVEEAQSVIAQSVSTIASVEAKRAAVAEAVRSAQEAERGDIAAEALRALSPEQQNELLKQFGPQIPKGE